MSIDNVIAALDAAQRYLTDDVPAVCGRVESALISALNTYRMAGDGSSRDGAREAASRLETALEEVEAVLAEAARGRQAAQAYRELI